MTAYLLRLKTENSQHLVDCKIGLFRDYKKAMSYLGKALYKETKRNFDFSLEVMLYDNENRLIEDVGVTFLDEE